MTVLVGRCWFAPVFRNLKMPFLLSVCSTSQCRDAGNGTSTRAGWAGVKAICIPQQCVGGCRCWTWLPGRIWWGRARGRRWTRSRWRSGKLFVTCLKSYIPLQHFSTGGSRSGCSRGVHDWSRRLRDADGISLNVLHYFPTTWQVQWLTLICWNFKVSRRRVVGILSIGTLVILLVGAYAACIDMLLGQ